jgi:hypothetical protein
MQMRIEIQKIAKGLNRDDSTGHGGAHVCLSNNRIKPSMHTGSIYSKGSCHTKNIAVTVLAD